MKVLSLLQPWASLLFVPANPLDKRRGAKEWETRSWKPSEKMIEYLKDEPLFIHSSKRFNKDQKDILKSWPFSEFLKGRGLPCGFIIGSVCLREIVTTEHWIQGTIGLEDGAIERKREEYEFGDYTPGRYAWRLYAPRLLKEPIPAKGSLGIWDFDYPNELLHL